MGQRIEEIAEHAGRPPEHVRRKLAEHDASADEDQASPRREPARLFRAKPEVRIAGSYIVSIRPGVDPLDVAARHGVDPSSVEGGFNTFSAEMTDAQVDSIRTDPDIDHLSEDQRIGPA